MSYSPWGLKESDTIEQLRESVLSQNTHTHNLFILYFTDWPLYTMYTLNSPLSYDTFTGSEV